MLKTNTIKHQYAVELLVNGEKEKVVVLADSEENAKLQCSQATEVTECKVLSVYKLPDVRN